MILQGENWCWSLVVLKGVKSTSRCLEIVWNSLSSLMQLLNLLVISKAEAHQILWKLRSHFQTTFTVIISYFLIMNFSWVWEVYVNNQFNSFSPPKGPALFVFRTVCLLLLSSVPLLNLKQFPYCGSQKVYQYLE